MRCVNSSDNNKRKRSFKANAFTDEIEILEKHVLNTSIIDIDKDKEKIQSIDLSTSEQAKLFKEEINRNSKVQIKYVNNDKSLSIQLVQTENNKSSIASGMQKIYYKSPLAQALIGRGVGDIVKIGNLDTFVEIIKIKN